MKNALAKLKRASGNWLLFNKKIFELKIDLNLPAATKYDRFDFYRYFTFLLNFLQMN